MSALFSKPKVPKVQPIPEVEDTMGAQNARLRRLAVARSSTIFGGANLSGQQAGVATKTLLGG